LRERDFFEQGRQQFFVPDFDREFDKIKRHGDLMFKEFDKPFGKHFFNSNVTSDEKNFINEIVLPKDVKLSDVKIEFKNNRLKIELNKVVDEKNNKSSSYFSTLYTVNTKAKESDIKKELKEGKDYNVLKIVVPVVK